MQARLCEHYRTNVDKVWIIQSRMYSIGNTESLSGCQVRMRPTVILKRLSAISAATQHFQILRSYPVQEQLHSNVHRCGT